MMRNPLDRRMFANPQQRRSAARGPQGILASGPRIMQAAMEQEPVRMQTGGVNLMPGSRAYGKSLAEMFGFGRFSDNTGAMSGSPSMDESVTPPPLSPAPGPGAPTGDMPGAADIPSTEPGDVNFGPELIGGAPYPQPGAVALPAEEPITPLPKADTAPPAEDDRPKSVFDELKQILETTTPEGNKKATKEYVDEAKKLLKEYGIEAPDLKSRRDLRIMEFFLNMAAGQSPYALTNIGTAAKEAFRGYGDDVREVESAEQKLKLAGLEMGMAEEARDEAASQALLLKKYDIAADLFEKINDLPDKSQQIKVLMETYDVPQEDAIKMVYPGKTVAPQGYEIRRDDFIKMGHSPTVAAYLSAGGATLLASLAEGNPIGDQIAAAATAAGRSLTPQDAKILGVQTTSVGN